MNTLLRTWLASESQRAWALIAGLMTGSVVLWLTVLGRLEAPVPDAGVPWWALALMFAAVESFVVHLHFRSESGSFSLFEVPLVIGLVFVAPQLLWLATLLGTTAAFIVVRRLPLIKIAFNAANLSMHAALSAILLAGLLGGADPLSPSGWVLVALATTIAGFGQIIALAGVIVITEGTLQRSRMFTMLLLGAIISSANTAQALVAAVLIVEEPTSLVLLGASVSVLFASYRAYTSERDQRERVEFLYTSTKALRDTPETTTAASALLTEAASMFRAARADLYLLPGPSDPEASCFRHESGVTSAATDGQTDKVAAALVDFATVPVRAKLEDAPGPIRRYLKGEGIRDAMIGTLHGANRDIAVLVVANRLGNVTTFQDPDLRLFDTLVQHAAVALENDQLEHALAEMRRLEQDLAHQASHDGLTGIANRSLFNEQLADALAKGESVAVLYVDLDDFKVVNDSLGHDAGDQVLSETARRIRQVVRPSDLVARLGGDEFAVMLRGNEEPTAIAHRIVRELREEILIGDRDIQVGASIGVATSTASSSAAALLADADIAMYAAKSGGKGSMVEFRPAMKDQLSRQRRLRAQLRLAVDRDEFRVVYQPIVDLATERPVGAEALVRWQTAEGQVLPDSFIGEAERAGLIVPIDRSVLGMVVDDLAAVGDRDVEDAPFVSVNLSAWNFQETDLVDHFSRTLLAADVRTSRVVVEITESALLRDPDRTVAQLQAFKDIGIRIALDDFGTGYSSLSYLRRLPVDILKIAQPFVADLGRDHTFVRAMIDLGKNLGLTILVEGIETAEQRDVLRELGCDLGQGYLFGRPAPRTVVEGSLLTAEAAV